MNRGHSSDSAALIGAAELFNRRPSARPTCLVQADLAKCGRPPGRAIGTLARFSGGEIRARRHIAFTAKVDSVCFEQSEHQIFRKEAGIPDVPGG